MNIITDIASEFLKHNIECFFVGGCVRDSILGIECDDIDICLVNVVRKDLVIEILSKFTNDIAEEVGNKFPVWIATIPGIGKVDFALARSEKKVGNTRHDFDVNTEAVTIVDDLLRRDLTINAIAQNVLTKQIVDPFNGLNDLTNRIAREVSDAFAEDELRVIRAARFCSRFNLVPSNSLITLCKTLSAKLISKERIGSELKKVLNQGENLSNFFTFLHEVGWLEQIFPQFAGKLSQISEIQHTSFIGRIVALTNIISQKEMFSLLNGISFMNKSFNKVVTSFSEIDKSSIRRFVRHLMNIDFPIDLLNSEICPFNVNDIKSLLDSNSMEPIVNGGMLLKLGMKPSKEMKLILDKCISLQDDGILNVDNWINFITLQ